MVRVSVVLSLLVGKLVVFAGTRLAKTAEAIGMSVRGLNSKSSQSDLEAMLQEADIISLHCSLTPKTHHLIG